jgi:hypothetical protein
MSSVAVASQPGAQLDSMQVTRVPDGLETRLFGRASAPTGPGAMSLATRYYRHFQSRADLRSIEFSSAYLARDPGLPPGEDLRFTISFVAPMVER